MASEETRANAERKAAEQKAKDDAKVAARSWRHLALAALPTKAIARHRFFVAILAVWGAALLGLSVLSLSNADMTGLSALLGFGPSARLSIAAIAAIIGGAVAALVARALRQSLTRGAQAEPTHSDPEHDLIPFAPTPIDPASDLGEENQEIGEQDDPVAPAEVDRIDDQRESANIQDAVTERADAPDVDEETQAAPAKAPPAAASEELDLGAYTEVEEDRDFEEAEKAAASAASALLLASRASAQSGVEKLRQTAPGDLSLVQLVERFAAALNDLQPTRSESGAARTLPDIGPERERALAEALKVLEAFTENERTPAPVTKKTRKPGRFGASFGGQASGPSPSSPSDAERDLREALAKLQNLQGAA
ncbi:MAG: hypothetical protein QNI87_07200 [Erythrobacter sp.]|uniref:hypothetical protein n=1 Tax=Erythrobacter sp. TaxID=1042 RepID=UPI0026345CFF|nr:hypothetical protein [Erythrobacter sp.]MDJ0978306.1 hypothetical protein [Erythrobacter sp.]